MSRHVTLSSLSVAPFFPSRPLRRAMTVVVALTALVKTVFAADPISTKELMDRRPQWDRLMAAPLTVEGRPTIVVGNELRFTGSELKFVLEPEVASPRGKPASLSVTGRLVKVGDGYEFHVSQLAEWKSESDVIRERLRGADFTDPAVFRRLGDWVSERATFYDDSDLRRQASDLYERGVRAAAMKARGNPQTLLTLADEVLQRGLPEPLRSELLHEATRGELSAEASRAKPEFSVVQQNVRSRFPAAATPLASLPPLLAAQYEKDPLGTYQSADAATRAVLERMLFVELTRRTVEQQAKPDGSNGVKMAAILEAMAPELADRTKQYRAAELAYHEGRLSTMTREEVLEFKALLRRLGDPGRGVKAARAWIDERYRGRPTTPTNIIQRAVDELEIAEDSTAALNLASRAMQTDPRVDGGAVLLTRLGYAWYGGRAIPSAEVPAAPVDQFAAAIKEGRILTGMTDAQVRAALGGEPQSVIHMASRGRATELWHYPEQRLTLYLRTDPQKGRHEVYRIIDLTK